jgi:hypothetical protein
MELSNEDIFKFIEFYKSEPVIWDPKNASHGDRNKVNSAWERIKVGMEKAGKQFSVKQLKTKKDVLMATFRKLSQRVRQSNRFGHHTLLGPLLLTITLVAVNQSISPSVSFSVRVLPRS